MVGALVGASVGDNVGELVGAFVGAATQTSPKQVSLLQSLSKRQDWLTSQPPQFSPPQSTSVSSPPLTSFVHSVLVGLAVVGETVGYLVGDSVGAFVGLRVGVFEGAKVGASVGLEVVGAAVGASVGAAVFVSSSWILLYLPSLSLCGKKVPAGQTSHSLAPGTEYVPAGQTNLSSRLPSGHS